MATRDVAAAFVRGLLSDQFHLPPRYFKDDDDLRAKWLFDNASLVALGAQINHSERPSKYVTPTEMVACNTVGNVIDLVATKNIS